MASISKQSRIKGSLYGVAVVDALGGPVEFKARGSFQKVTGYRHNGTFNVPPGYVNGILQIEKCNLEKSG